MWCFCFLEINPFFILVDPVPSLICIISVHLVSVAVPELFPSSDWRLGLDVIKGAEHVSASSSNLFGPNNKDARAEKCSEVDAISSKGAQRKLTGYLVPFDATKPWRSP